MANMTTQNRLQMRRIFPRRRNIHSSLGSNSSSWRSPHADMPMRRRMIVMIKIVFDSMERGVLTRTRNPNILKTIELHFYTKASSPEEYVNVLTIRTRIIECIRSIVYRRLSSSST